MSDPTNIPSWLQAQEAPPPPPPEVVEEEDQLPEPPKPVRIKEKLKTPTLGFILNRLWQERKTVLGEWKPPRGSRVRLRNLAIYVRQLGLMLNGGLSLLKSFEILGTQGEDKLLRKASLAVKEDLLAGRSLSQAFLRQPDIFPSFLIFTASSAEVAGTLPASLLRLADYYEKENLRYSKVRASLVYPAFVFSFAMITFFGMVGYIFPLFADFFAGLNFKLPFITRALFFIFGLLDNRWFWMGAVGFAVFLYVVLGSAMKKPDFVLRLNIYTLQVPMMGKLIQKIAGSHLCRSLSTMLEAGVFMLTAFEVLRKGESMPIFKILLYTMEEDIRSGNSVASALSSTNLFPRVVEDMVSIGEESGKIQIMMEKAADFLDLEIETLLQNLTALIEPILILFLGIMVGAILIGLFLPLYGAIGQIH